MGTKPAQALVAQLGERLVYTQEVGGSIPSGGTVGEVEVVDTPGCDPGRSGFKSRRSPQPPRRKTVSEMTRIDSGSVQMISQLLADNYVVPCVVQPDGDGIAIVCPLRTSREMRELLAAESFEYVETQEKDYAVFSITNRAALSG